MEDFEFKDSLEFQALLGLHNVTVSKKQKLKHEEYSRRNSLKNAAIASGKGAGQMIIPLIMNFGGFLETFFFCT